MGLLTWSPLAHGMLTGAYEDADTWPKGTRAGNRGAFYAARVTPEGVRIGREFGKLAREAGLSPARLAVLWCKDQPGVTAPIVGGGQHRPPRRPPSRPWRCPSTTRSGRRATRWSRPAPTSPTSSTPPAG